MNPMTMSHRAREHGVPCRFCFVTTFARNAVCEDSTCQARDAENRKLRPCRGCGRPINGPRRWCSTACFLDTEGHPAADDTVEVVA